MRLPPNCVKFFTAIKEIDEEEFWDEVYKDMEKAKRYGSCAPIDDEFATGDWDKFLDGRKISFLDGWGWDFVERVANRKPHIKALLKAQADPTDTENDYSVEDYLGDNPDWDRDYFDDLFDRLSNNREIETNFKDYVSDWIYDCRTEYSKYASRKVTASDRSALIRLASTMPVGSPERKAILAGLTRNASSGLLSRLEAAANTRLKPGRNNIFGYPIDLPDQEANFLLYFYPVDEDAAKGLIDELRALRFKVRYLKNDKSIVLT